MHDILYLQRPSINPHVTSTSISILTPAGARVFIWGGVRALERLCVQLCSEWGCEVTCVGPLYTHQYLASLGAAHVLPDDMADLARLLQTGKR